MSQEPVTESTTTPITTATKESSWAKTASSVSGDDSKQESTPASSPVELAKADSAPPTPKANVWKLRQESSVVKQQPAQSSAQEKKITAKKTPSASVSAPTTPERPRSPMPAKIVRTPARSENVLKKNNEPAVALTVQWPSLAAALEAESDASSSNEMTLTNVTGGPGKKSWAKMEIDIVFPRPSGAAHHHGHNHIKKKKAERRVQPKKTKSQATEEQHQNTSANDSKPIKVAEKLAASHENTPLETADAPTAVNSETDLPSSGVTSDDISNSVQAAEPAQTPAYQQVHHHNHGMRYASHSGRGRGTFRNHRTGPSMPRPNHAPGGIPQNQGTRGPHHTNRPHPRMNNGYGAPQYNYYPMPQYQPYVMPPQPQMAPYPPSMYYPMGDPSFMASPIPTGPVDVSLVEMETIKYWIRCQIEYYFSPENLLRDTYFRTQMNLTDGAVPLGLILGFNRVKNLMSMALEKTKQAVPSTPSDSQQTPYPLPDSMSSENANTSSFAIESVKSSLDVSDTIELISRQDSEGHISLAVRRKGDWMRWILPVAPALDRQSSSSYSAVSSTSTSSAIMTPQLETSAPQKESVSVPVKQVEVQGADFKQSTDSQVIVEPAGSVDAVTEEKIVVESSSEEQVDATPVGDVPPQQVESAVESQDAAETRIRPSTAAEAQSAPSSDTETTPQKKKTGAISYAMVSAAGMPSTKFPTPPLSPPNVSTAEKKQLTPATKQAKKSSSEPQPKSKKSSGNTSTSIGVNGVEKPKSSNVDEEGWETATRKKQRPQKTHHYNNNNSNNHQQRKNHGNKSIKHQLFQPSRDDHFKDVAVLSLDSLWLVVAQDLSVDQSQQEKTLNDFFGPFGGDDATVTLYTPWKKELPVLGLVHTSFSEQDILRHINGDAAVTVFKYTTIKEQFMKSQKKTTDSNEAKETSLEARIVYLVWTFLLTFHLNQGSLYKDLRNCAIHDARQKSTFGMECVYQLFSCMSNLPKSRTPSSTQSTFLTQLGFGPHHNKHTLSVYHLNDLQFLVREEVLLRQIEAGIPSLLTLIALKKQDKGIHVTVLPDLVKIFADYEEKQKSGVIGDVPEVAAPNAQQDEVLIR